MRGPQGVEWIIILLIVLLLFGASRLPGLARSVGKSVRIFKTELKDDGDRAAPGETRAPGSRPPDSGPTVNDDGAPRA